jgi:hypothetical protein
MKYISFSFLFTSLVLLSVSFNSSASNKAKRATNMQASQLLTQNKELLFEENKGQLKDQNGQLLPNIKYYGHQGGMYLYIKSGMISFVFNKIENAIDNDISEASGLPIARGGIACSGTRQQLNGIKITTSRMDFVLIGSNSTAKITATDLQEYYENFYTTGDADRGITNVHTFKTITYKEIYPLIDMILKTTGQGIEYSFLVHPGGNLDDIKLKWNGDNRIKAMKNGGNLYTNSLGNIYESAPKSFVNSKEVKSSFIRKGPNYGFKVRDYDKSRNLLIDPSLIWATYFGGSKEDIGYSISSDASGNVYITGETSSLTGIASSGAYQTSYAGGKSDVFLTKINSSGNIIWATYYGGNNEDQALSISTDALGNLYITGYTNSTSGISTSGSYQTSYGGGSSDVFLAKFKNVGSLVWATYYGGDNIDQAWSIYSDVLGDVQITGETGSKSGIATSGSYQTSIGGGQYSDAFLAKFNSSGNLTWATYIGGSGDNYGNGVTVDGSGNVFLTGYTDSKSGIATSSGYQTSYGGGLDDAFLFKFSSSGVLSWATYYGGGDFDLADGICADASGYIYITGYTFSGNSIATTGAFQTSLGGKSDAFLAKFSISGSLLWATYYGGSGGDRSLGICLDASGNLNISGVTNSPNGISTSGAYQTSFVGGTDAFLANFNNSGAVSWATYFGGNGDDYAISLSTDGSGNLYITGETTSISSIATPGAQQTSNNGGTFDAFLAKFNISTSGIKNDMKTELSSLNIFPNPFRDKTTIDLSLREASYVKITLMDIAGNILFTPMDKMLGAGQNEIDINTTASGLSPGIYFVNIIINDKFIQKKIIDVI